MKKKYNSQFAKELTSAVDNRKGDIADVVGMPDEQDYNTLLKIIQKFEKRNPGLINYTLRQGREDFQSGAYGKRLTWENDAIINKQANMVYSFELPRKLYTNIEAVFPSMFKSKKHLQWFKKNFYKMTIAQKEIK